MPTDVMKHSPRPLREYMKRHNLTQHEMADRIGASQAAISMWLLGTTKMSVKRAADIEKRTGGEITRQALLPRLFTAA